MTERITFLKNKDNWCFGIDFFIQAALFECTGYADWITENTEGPCDNMHDGEIDSYIKAKRIISETWEKGECTKRIFDKIEFKVHGNVYSYQSIYKSALENIKQLEK